MLTQIRRYFEQPERTLQSLPGPDRQHLAAAALLVEAARLDDAVTQAEITRILELLQSRFDLSAEAAQELLEAAQQVTEGPAQWHAFTSQLKDAFSYEERVGLIEMLWEVVYADGTLHHLESNLLRRVGGLLYVEDRDRGEARRRVLERMGRPTAADQSGA